MAKANLIALILIPLLLAPFLAIPQESNAQAASSSDDWPMFHHDPAHTGEIISSAPTATPILVWSIGQEETHGEHLLDCVVVDGIVYASGASLYALNASTGAKLWNYPLQSKLDGNGNPQFLSASPAIANGRIYIGSLDNFVVLENGTNVATPTLSSTPLSTPSGRGNGILIAVLLLIVIIVFMGVFLFKRRKR